MPEYYVYMMCSPNNQTLYIGVTNDLARRVYQHKAKEIEGFTKQYNITKLVCFEQTLNIEAAILREKQLKGWLRARKNELIDISNPDWKDLPVGYAQDPSLRSG